MAKIDFNIAFDGLDITASDEAGNEIGRVAVEEIDGEPGFSFFELTDMNVDTVYQRKGIGTELLDAAFEECPNLILPQDYDGSCKGSEIRNPLTEQGRAFILSYKKKNSYKNY